jgi:hypothetical protein
MNPQMFNSFLDGTKSAIEMVAIANACGLDVPEDGLGFPPCGVDDLAHVLARALGGRLDGAAWSRWSPRSNATAARCSATCAGASTSCCGAERLCRGLLPPVRPADRRHGALRGDVQALPPDRHGALISVLSAALRREPTGQARACAATGGGGANAPSGRARCSTARAATPSGARRRRCGGRRAAHRARARGTDHEEPGRGRDRQAGGRGPAGRSGSRPLPEHAAGPVRRPAARLGVHDARRTDVTLVSAAPRSREPCPVVPPSIHAKGSHHQGAGSDT